MAGSVYYKSVKRLGARYGRRIRQKLGMIESESRALQVCPYCGYKRVKRQAVGIFLCRKCNAKFASAAYAPVLKKHIVQPKIEEEQAEEEVKEDG